MIQILAGEKGSGKTKKLLEMANSASKTAKGNVVFIDNNNRYIYDLNYQVRFIDTSEFVLENLNVFLGFICGILSQDRDIEKIYIDGLNNIVKTFSSEDMEKFIKSLEKISSSEDVDFIMIVSCPANLLSEYTAKFFI